MRANFDCHDDEPNGGHAPEFHRFRPRSTLLMLLASCINLHGQIIPKRNDDTKVGCRPMPTNTHHVLGTNAIKGWTQ